MLPPPPSPTLFPYTTLFRSVRVPRRLHGVHLIGPAQRPVDAFLVVGVDAGQEGAQRDRKSTRLNSSHLVSSYAVFCLKKKTELYFVETQKQGRHHVARDPTT